MPRIGEVLVAAGLATAEQVAEGLRAQVMWGARLGTNLVELGFVTLDELTRGLASQHRLPAALKSHFERADATLQRRLSARLAKKYDCVPIVRAGQRVVFASIAPLTPAGLAAVANELGVRPEMLIPSIAAELRVRYHLEQLYRIERDPRFLRARGTRSEDSQVFRLAPTIDPALERELADEEHSVADGIPTPVAYTGSSDAEELPAPPPSSEPPKPYDPLDGERRSYLRTLADILAKHPDRAAVEETVARLTADAADPDPAPKDLATARRAIFRGRDRDRVARRAVAAIEHLVPAGRSVLLLTVRGQAAVSWTGFCRDGTDLPAIAVPLDKAGLLPMAIKRNQLVRGASGNLDALDYLLLASLGARHGDLVIVPVAIGENVYALFAVAAEYGGMLDGIEAIAEAAGAGFARLMRDASTNVRAAAPAK